MFEQESFKSTLEQLPLPQILSMIEDYKIPGKITVSHHGVEKKIYIEDKYIVFAGSNVDDDRLGEFLIRKGKIKQIDYDNSVTLLKKTGKRQGQIFVSLGCLSAKELFWAVKTQVQDIVLSLFLWSEGEIEFTPGHFVESETIKLRASISEIIMEGVRKIQNPRRFVKYLGGKDSLLNVTPNAIDIMEKKNLGKDYYDIFNLINGKKTLEQLIAECTKPGTESVRYLYILLVFNILEKVSPKPE